MVSIAIHMYNMYTWIHTGQHTNTHLFHIIITTLKVFASFYKGHYRIAGFLSTHMNFQKPFNFYNSCVFAYSI